MNGLCQHPTQAVGGLLVAVGVDDGHVAAVSSGLFWATSCPDGFDPIGQPLPDDVIVKPIHRLRITNVVQLVPRHGESDVAGEKAG